MKELYPQDQNHIENKSKQAYFPKEIKNFPLNSLWISVASRM